MPQRTYVIVTIALLTTRIAAAQQLSPRLQNKEFVIESVALMPVQVEVSRSGMKGAEGMPEAASQLTTMLQDIIQAELRALKLNASEERCETVVVRLRDALERELVCGIAYRSSTGLKNRSNRRSQEWHVLS